VRCGAGGRVSAGERRARRVQATHFFCTAFHVLFDAGAPRTGATAFLAITLTAAGAAGAGTGTGASILEKADRTFVKDPRSSQFVLTMWR